MDKNTKIALVLCFAILVGFWWFNKPSEEQRAQWQHYYDSLAQVEQLRNDSIAHAREVATVVTDTVTLSDSAKSAVLSQKYGLLAGAVEELKIVLFSRMISSRFISPPVALRSSTWRSMATPTTLASH